MLDFLNRKKEKAKFSILYKIIQSKTVEIVTDNKNYFFARSDIANPIMLWTKKNISIKKQFEAMRNLNSILTKDSLKQFTCNVEFYNFLDSNNFNIDDKSYFEMGSYFCNKPIQPNINNGQMMLASQDDIDTLSKLYILNEKEMENIEIGIEKAKSHITNLVNNKMFYVWKNLDNKIVCTAVVQKYGETARINHVYTIIEERGKGYAKNLVYELTKQVLNEGFLPTLYTDLNYPASNKAYIAVGYKYAGKLISFASK